MFQPCGMLRLVPRRYIIVILGFLSFAVLNAQRVNLALALVVMTNSSSHAEINHTVPEACAYKSRKNETEHYIKREQTFNWDSRMEGYIISSTFVGFFLTQLPGGRLAEALGAKEVLSFSIFCASLCNVLSPLAAAWNIYIFIAAQFIKGMAQGFIQPALSSLMARWYPKKERSFLSSVTYSGYPAGALVGGIVSGTLCDTKLLGGWPSAFYVFGFSGIILVLIEILLVYNSPEEYNALNVLDFQAAVNETGPKSDEKLATPWFKIIFSIPTWALLAGMIGQYWMTFYFISVHPAYLSNVLNLDITQSGIFTSLPYILQIFVTWLGSSVSDWFSKRNYATTDTVRKFCNTLSCLGFSLSMLGVIFAGCSITLNTLCFFIAMSSIGLGFPGSLTVPMDMTKDFAGTLMGFSATIASSSGFIIPVIVGYVTNKQGTILQWSKVIYISVAIVMGSAIVFHAFGSAKLQNWDVETEKIEKTASKKNHKKTVRTISDTL